jgi:hypothetical protein
MDKHEDEATSGIPATAGDPAAAASMPATGLPQPGEPKVEAKSELVSVDSPSIAPTTVEMTADAAAVGLDAPKIARAHAQEEFKQAKPEIPDAAPAGAREIVPLAALAHARATWKFSKFTVLAATIVLAAAFGATAGVLGATGLARLVAGEPAPAEVPEALQTTITQLRSDIAALKAGVDATNRNTNTQYSKLVERFDRVERAQSAAGKSDASKSDAALPKETTGSVTPPNAAAPPPVPPAGVVAGWSVRDVYRGVAMLQSRVGGMVEVEPGDVLPGLGRIAAIRRQDGRWVVITSKGMITSLR